MNIVTLWKNAFLVCLPKNSKILLYAFVRTIKDVYSLLWHNVSQTLIVYGISYVLAKIVWLLYVRNSPFLESDAAMVVAQTSDFVLYAIFGFLSFVQIVLAGLLFFYTMLFARSSIQKKDYAYICEWRRKYIGIFFCSVILGMFFTLLWSIPLVAIFAWWRSLIIFLIFLTTVFYKSIYFIFLFFILDTVQLYAVIPAGKVKKLFLLTWNACKNSFKMVLFNLPLFLIVGAISMLIGLIIDFCVGLLLPALLVNHVLDFLNICCMPMIVSLYNVLYTKYAYEQIDLYIEGAKE